MMYGELNDLLRFIVDCRFAVAKIANEVIQAAHKGEPVAYRGHDWTKEHYEAMERVHLAVEAAFSYAKWLQFPEAKYRLDEGSQLLAELFADQKTSPPLLQAVSWETQLVAGESSLDQDPPIHSVAPVITPTTTKGAIMTSKHTVASVAEWLQDLSDRLDEQVGNLNDQFADIEQRLDKLEENGQKDGRKKRNMTDEQRQEAGRRLQQARADKLGLDTIEQLRALHLRPGAKPTKAQLAKVMKDFPAKKK